MWFLSIRLKQYILNFLTVNGMFGCLILRVLFGIPNSADIEIWLMA
jgi:hypothetical protein